MPRLLLAGALCALAAVPGTADARRFGSNLNKSANNHATCANGFPFAQGATSCLAYGVVPSGYAPVSGVVTRVRVKTGNVRQGRMQVLVLRSYYQNNLQDPGHPNFFCCFLQRYGPVFTPRAGAVSTVKTAIGMVEDPTPPADDGNTVAKGDFLALSVLGPNIALPLHRGGSSGYTGFYAPAPRRGDTPAPSPNGLPGGQGAFTGFTLLLQAEIDPVKGRAALRSMAPAWQRLLVPQV
jgi:hypothetical protein